MANAIYPLWKQSLLSGDADADLAQTGASTAPYVALIDATAYTYSAAHRFYSSLTGIVGAPIQLASATLVNGVFDAADVTVPATAGVAVQALVIFRKNAGANTTWRLVYYCDNGIIGAPLNVAGGATLQWNASGIFAL